MSKIESFKDLIVYQKAYKLAMRIFEITRNFRKKKHTSEEHETETWIDYSKDCKYINAEVYQELTEGYDEVRKMLVSMITNPDQWCTFGK